jgi:hypothetical protein
MDKKKTSSAKKSSSSRTGSRPASKNSKPRNKSSKRNAKKVDNFISKYPTIDYEKLLEVPEVSLTIKYDQNRSESFDIKLPINFTLRKVKEKINERNGNSLHNIKIFLLENSVKKYMEIFSFHTFKQLGIKPGENINLFYEFEPAVHPLLEAGSV